MLRELQANAYKEGWDGMTRRQHLREIDYHLAKLKAAVRSGEGLRILEFGADIGNHVCFLLEHLDVLTPERLVERAEEPSFVAPTWRTYLRMALRSPRWVWKSAQGIFKKPYERHPEPSLDGFG